MLGSGQKFHLDLASVAGIPNDFQGYVELESSGEMSVSVSGQTIRTCPDADDFSSRSFRNITPVAFECTVAVDVDCPSTVLTMTNRGDAELVLFLVAYNNDGTQAVPQSAPLQIDAGQELPLELASFLGLPDDYSGYLLAASEGPLDLRLTANCGGGIELTPVMYLPNVMNF